MTAVMHAKTRIGEQDHTYKKEHVCCLESLWVHTPPLAASCVGMSEYVDESHDVTVFLYHLVFPAKYRRAVVDETVDCVLKKVCLALEAGYRLKFLEIGTDKGLFKRCPEVKRLLWGGEFRTDVYFACITGRQGNEQIIGAYVKAQGQAYVPLHQDHQFRLV